MCHRCWPKWLGPAVFARVCFFSLFPIISLYTHNYELDKWHWQEFWPAAAVVSSIKSICFFSQCSSIDSMCGTHGWHLHCLHRHRHQINMTANIQPPHVLLEGTIKFRDNKKVNINNGTPYFCFFLCNQSNHLCIFVVVILVESTMGCRLQVVARCRFVFFLFLPNVICRFDLK